MEIINIKRHSLSHILAQAIQREIDNEIKLGVGPCIENGFYYDVLGQTIKEDDLKKIQNQVEKIIKEGQKIHKVEVDYNIALEINNFLKQNYKIEMINDLKKEGETKFSFYINTINQNAKQAILKGLNEKYTSSYEKINEFLENKKLLPNGEFAVFIDMCEGPHIENTKEIDGKGVKIVKIAGAYRKGDEKNIMMQRIYGYAFETKEELKNYIEFLEEAKKRDHRIIGPKMGLYEINADVGIGLPLWKPKGATIINTIKRWFEDEQIKRGYVPVITPHIGRKVLWEKSGHWGFYNESMYPPIELGQSLGEYQDNRKPSENETYLLKPMNCPFHIMIYNSDKHSYKEFPIKYYEFGTVYRYEQKGELGGLTRVRGFTQDDAHIICRPDQLNEEFEKVADFVTFVLGTFGFKDIKVYLSKRDPNNKKKYLGNDQMWDIAEGTIRSILQKKGMNFVEEEGEAAFYGPKADFKAKTSIGKEFQLSTIQFDFNLPEKFDVKYIDENGNDIRPFVIHRALLGSIERFMGILIEHFGGAFPLWIAPIQIKIIPVIEKFIDGGKHFQNKFQENGFRTEIDISEHSLNKKIRNAELEKIPYILIIGEKEIENNTVSIREYSTKKQYEMSIEKFLEKIISENNFKK